MACATGFCFTEFTDLCDNVGRSCISIETVFGGLIENQFALASAIAPVIEDVAGFGTCERVHFDTATGTYTATASATTVPIGIHLFGGRVATDGRASCVNVGCAPGTQPVAGAFLDDELCVTDEGNASFILLEDSTIAGCTFAMKLPGPSTAPWSYIARNSAAGVVVPANTAAVATTDSVVVPYDGFYMVSYNVNTETPQPRPFPDADINYVTIRSNDGTTNTRYSDQEGELTDFFQLMDVSEGLCLQAGDTIFGTVAQSTSPAQLNPSTAVSSNFTVIYLGPGGC